MSTQVQHRRGTTVQHASFTGAEGEITVDTTTDSLVVHDGATVGGIRQASQAFVVEQVATVAAGNFQSLFISQNSIYP